MLHPLPSRLVPPEVASHLVQVSAQELGDWGGVLQVDEFQELEELDQKMHNGRDVESSHSGIDWIENVLESSCLFKKE